MARPQRIEFENAYYHVMNRGAGRCDIFQNDKDRNRFLTVIAEAHQQFKIEIHAYCLMSNHYHLLIKTPKANLGRAMRHINGVYTQRYNRCNHTDGPLFRGRYKAILVDSDAYLLHLSKYIHLNPITAHLTEHLEAYHWSSYLAYINKTSCPSWLFRSEIYSQLTVSPEKTEAYQRFMSEQALNTPLTNFYEKQRLFPVLGDDAFIQKLHLKTPPEETPQQDQIKVSVDIPHILSAVSSFYQTKPEALLLSHKGHKKQNIPRKIAMYIAQKHTDYRLKEIATTFGLKHYGSVSHAIYSISEAMKSDHVLSDNINSIINRLDP